jgi:nitroreductase
MVRSFSSDPVEPAVVDRLVEAALRAPTAGNTRAADWVVLAGSDETSIYFDSTTDDVWRGRHPARAAGLRRAPVVLLSYVSPAAYVARYAEADKSCSGLGEGTEHWPLPYWYGDAAMAVHTVLLGATEAGLAACFLGAFRGEGELARRLGVPDAWRLFGAVLLGHADGNDHGSPSLTRSRAADHTRIHRGAW